MPGEFIITEAARDLIGRRGITADGLRGLRKKIIKSADVQALLVSCRSGPETPEGERRSPARQITARRGRGGQPLAPDDPAAYCAGEGRGGRRSCLPAEPLQRSEYPVGIPELLVKCIAVLHAEFGLFFASLRDDGAAVQSDTPRVGVTVDVGTGLSVPVVTDARDLSLPDVGQALAGFRVRALRRRLSETDLAGANIALALNDDEGIVAAQPLILPPLVCMLNLCSVQQELRLRDGGEVGVGRYFHLGLAYDHRLINGREAALFLRAIKAIMEDPDRMERLARAEAALTNTDAVREQDEPTLVEIVAAVVGVDPGELTDEDGPATVGAWTSRKQMELLVTLEEFYGLDLGQQEILGAPTIGALREVLRARRPG